MVGTAARNEYHARSDRQPEHAAAKVQREKSPFAKTAQAITRAVGTTWVVVGAIAVAVIWVILGSVTDFPRWWELLATIGLPFVSLLMLVVIQHTQNHESRAMHLKLDELIRAVQPAEDRMMTIEDAGSHELDAVRAEFQQQAEEPE